MTSEAAHVTSEAADVTSEAAAADARIRRGAGDTPSDVQEDRPIISINGACATWSQGQDADSAAAQRADTAVARAGDAAKVKDHSSDPSTGQISFSLSGITLSARRGELHMIVGEVGCGKSSLLQMILGEMRLTVESMPVLNSHLQAPRLGRLCVRC